MSDSSALLHPSNLGHVPIISKRLSHYLIQRAANIRDQTAGLSDPNLSIVIRTRNNEVYLADLFKDIKRQKYSGKIEIIVVDTESTDRTLELSKKAGARIMNIKQQDFNYPKALNMGFKVAKYPYIKTIVGHSSLSNIYTFKALTYWAHQPNFGGVYGTPLPNWNASRTERWGTVLAFGQRFKKPLVLTKPLMGMLGSNGAVLKASVWQEMGGFNERYGAGGEDGVIGRQILAKGLLVIREPLMSVHHSHGLGPINSIKQYQYWLKLAEPHAFDDKELQTYRTDMS